jgi:predicted ATPase
VIRVAAVVGMTFAEDVVAEVIGERVDTAVYERLADASLIVRLQSAGWWRFGHPLIHDAAYGGLLGTSRRRLHARVADLLEQRPGREAIGAIARHRVSAGDGERAVPLLVEAAEEAFALGATAEAASFWTSAGDIAASPEDADRYRQRARDALEAIPADRPPSD